MLDSIQCIDESGQWLETHDFRFRVNWLPSTNAVIAAIRPEGISLHTTDASEEDVEFKVYAVLPAGPEVFVHVVRGDVTLVVRMPPGLALEMDERVWVRIDPSGVNLYDPSTRSLIQPDNA